MAKAKMQEQVAHPQLLDDLATERIERKDKLRVHEGIIRRELIRKLEDFCAPAAGQLVSSYFLNIAVPSGSSVKAARIAAKDAMKAERDKIDSLDVPRAIRTTLHTDWDRVMELLPTVTGDRHARGLGCFVASDARQAWALTVPWPVRNRAFFEERFVVWPLKQIMEQFDRYVVCLTDKEHARLFFVYLERIEEIEDIFDEIPGRVRIPDPYAELKYLHKHVEHFHRHFAKVASATLRLLEHEPFQHLIIGGRAETLPQFESYLHRYLRGRIVARWEIDVGAPTAQILENAVAEEQRIVESQGQDIWKSIQDGRSRRGAIGAEEVFAALWQRRVQAMLVEPNDVRPGFRCKECGRLQSSGEACVECGSKPAAVSDVIQESVHDGVEQSAQVRYWKSPLLKQADPLMALKRF